MILLSRVDYASEASVLESYIHNHLASCFVNASPPPITILIKTITTSIRQRRRRITTTRNRTGQTEGPTLVSMLRGDLHSIRDHGVGLPLRVLHFTRRLVARKRIRYVRQVDDEHRIRAIAAEERGAFVQALCDERADSWDERHLC